MDIILACHESKFEVQQPLVAWRNVFTPQRIPPAEFYIQVLSEVGG